jgi:hypothetical protein
MQQLAENHPRDPRMRSGTRAEKTAPAIHRSRGAVIIIALNAKR